MKLPFLHNLVRWATNEINLVPVERCLDMHRVANDTVRQFLAFHGNCTHVLWSLEGADVRVTFDGSDPVAGANGHLFLDGATGVWRVELAQAARFTRNAGVNAAIHVTQLRER